MVDKKCSECGETKPLGAFYFSATCVGKVRPECKGVIRNIAASAINKTKRIRLSGVDLLS